MKKVLFVFLTGAFLLTFASLGFSAEKTVLKWDFVEGMGQGDFARLLVKATHAQGFLPAAATLNDVFKFWEGLGIIPPNGWNTDGIIILEDAKAMLGKNAKAMKDLTFEDVVQALIDNIMNLLEGRTDVIQGTSISPIAPKI